MVYDRLLSGSHGSNKRRLAVVPEVVHRVICAVLLQRLDHLQIARFSRNIQRRLHPFKVTQYVDIFATAVLHQQVDTLGSRALVHHGVAIIVGNDQLLRLDVA